MTPIAVIIAAAQKAGVSAALLLSVCFVESGHQTAINLSDGGSPSYGICQVKYETALMFGRGVRRSYLLSDSGSADCAARYLAYQLDRYRGDVLRAVSAYNAGTATKKNFRYVNKVVLARLNYEAL
jgi:soluble lytic murein transglycosylase-like protein